MNLSTKALITTTTIQSAASLACVAVPSVAPLVAADLGVSSSNIGSYISVVYIGATISALCGGTLVHRYGGIFVSSIALVFCALGMTLAVSPWIALFALSAILMGLGYGPMTPASSDILAHTTPSNKIALFFSIKQTGVPLGGVLAGLSVPILANFFGWRIGLLTVGALCLILIVLIWPTRRLLDNHTDKTVTFSLKSILNNLRLVISVKSLRMLAIVSFVFNGMQMCVSGFLVSYLVEQLSIPLVLAGLLLSCCNAGGVFGRIFWGIVADQTGSPRKTLAALGFLICFFATTLATLAFWDCPTWLLFAICISLGATSIGWNGVYLSQVARSAPEGKAGEATGGCLFFTFMGVIFIPTIFGLLEMATGSYPLCFTIEATCCGLMGVWLILSPSAPRNSTVQDS